MSNEIYFSSLNINPKVLDGINSLHPKALSEIEAKVIPLMLKDKSVIAVSPTGTGKTLSYVVPILSNLEKCKVKNTNHEIKYIIVIPTNVLGFQVENVFNEIIDKSNINDIKVFFFSSAKEIIKFVNDIDIAIITPSLFKTLTKKFNLKNLKSIVFDEGDMILFDGFYDDMDEICKSFPSVKKSFFSASIAKQFLTPVKKLCKADVIIDCNTDGINTKSISHFLIDLRKNDRNQAVKLILNDKNFKDKTGIIFVSTNDEIKIVKNILEELKIKYACITGNMDKRSIARNLKIFDSTNVKLLLATDYASRGLDMPYVQYVVSYTLPIDLNFYFHRAGRSGRFNSLGSSFVLTDENDLKKINELVKRGVNFKFIAIKKDEIVEVKSKPKSSLYKSQNPDYVKKAIYKAKKKVPNIVKPGYKKKIKTQINIAKDKHKKKIVRTNLSKKNNTYGNH